MIRVLIVEDDLFYLSFIEKKLMDLKKYEIVGIAESVIGAYNIIRAKAPDIIISDVKLKGNSSGFDLAKMIEDRNIPVLFMTESDDQKIYEQAADIVLSGILIKPFHIYSLDSSIGSLLQLKNSIIQSKGLAYTTGGIKHLIPHDDILYIQADKNYCTVVTEKSKYAYKISIVKLMLKVKENIFIQVHKSFVINIKKATNFNFSDSTILIGESKIPIGRTYKKKLGEYINH